MLNKDVLTKLKQYVDQHLEEHVHESSTNLYAESIAYNALDEFVTDNQQPEFREMLFHFIDEKETTDATIYKKAWMDRRHFSKIRSNPDYNIGKNTVIALMMALELSENEAEELLQAAGYALSNNDTHDLVIQFCLKNKIYNLHNVNEALDSMNLKPIGKTN